MARTPNRYGTEMRARKRTDATQPMISECITRTMTPEERVRMDSLSKSNSKQRVVGVNLWMPKDQGSVSRPDRKASEPRHKRERQGLGKR